MAIFHSYVKLPERNIPENIPTYSTFQYSRDTSINMILWLPSGNLLHSH